VLPRTRLEVARFRARRRAVLARLKWVNLALAAWDEWDAAQAMPVEVRPLVSRPGPLGRKALRELRRVLVDVMGELDAAWSRRN
jgi:hypothetical protein